jgi:hypothetical protein
MGLNAKSTLKCTFTGQECFNRYEIPIDVRGSFNWIKSVPACKEYMQYLDNNGWNKFDGDLIQLFMEKCALEIQANIIKQRLDKLDRKMEEYWETNVQKLNDIRKEQGKKNLEIAVANSQHAEHLEQKEVMKAIIEEKKKKLDFWE